VPPRHRNPLFSGTAEVLALSPPFNLKFDDGSVRRWSRRALLLIPIALIAWALLAWEPWNRISLPAKPVPVAAKTTNDGEQEHIQRMLDAAGLALSQGALIEPPGQNALEIYRAVIARDPGNSLARRGIDSVADELIVQAERALMEQDVTRLASTVDAVRSVRPEHPRLPFFVGQLEQERTLAAKSGQPIHAVDATGRPLEQPAPAPEHPSVRAQAFVQLAHDRMKSGQLVGKDGALGYVQSAKGIAAADAGVVAAATALAGLFNANAQEAIRAGRLDEADQWLQREIQLDADRAQIANLRADIDAARIGNQRADRARLLVLANQRIAQGRLLEPKGDSAQHYLDLLAAADPNFEGLADTQALFASRAMAEDKPAPSASAPPAAPEPVVLPEGKLKRTSFVEPTYPIGAREKRIEGWVDIEFTVTKDGTTRDAIVRAAEPEDTFDRAAIDAIRKWRYEPRVVNGASVDQRVETRLRFILSQE
jgi:TonB family protein